MIPWVLSIVTVTVLLLAVLMARVRGRQLQQLEAHHATQLESFAQGQRMATISRMATAIAHELSGPLTSIGDAAANLSARLGDSDPRPNTRELREHLESIAAQVRRAERVTDGLRHFSRYVHQESESVNVEACLDETLRLVEQGEGSRVRLVRHYAPDVPPIVSNLAQTQQVFLTLINSALDAVGARGEVHVHVIGAGRGVEIRIQDNGPGIPPEQLRHVFEPFSPAQTEPASTRGLGLSLCRDVMQSLGGRIAVASSPGQGTTFSLWFPSEQQG
jgi:signal transduction histidine kinase